MEPIRLQKYMADCGVASRRKSEAMILQGLVEVNGTIATEMGVRIDPFSDVVKVKGKVITPEQKTTLMLNKPGGYVCTFKNFPGEKSVSLLVPEGTKWHCIGRLDKNTTGLLLLTNDGQLTQKITHPAKKIKKVYHVTVLGKPDVQDIRALKKGIAITDETTTYITAPAQVRVLKTEGNQTYLEIAITEGKKRQVRRMCEAVNCKVTALKRVAVGGLVLGNLPEGQYKQLKEKDIRKIFLS